MPSFLKGVGSVLDIAGCLNNPHISNMTDSDAIREDWKVVGHDVTVVFDNLKQEVK